MNRRDFLKTSSAASAALVVGFQWQPAQAAANAEPALANAWLKIGSDNSITLTCHRSEMGQDTYTSIPMLIAEELDVPLEKVKVEMAPSAAVYINAMLGGQITGGSTSIRDAWLKLRTAGAAARQMLLQAGANQFGVPVGVCSAADGVVSGGGKSATYGQLAAAASKLPVPSNPPLKVPAEFKYIGNAAIKRLDTRVKVTGKAVYGVDVRQPKMAVAVLEQSPVIGGKLLSMDDSALKGIKGLLGVISVPDGVAVLAKDYYTANRARKLLKTSWDHGPSKDVNMAGIRAQMLEAMNKPGAMVKKAGQSDNPMAGAVTVIKADYELPFLAHATLEPVNCSAQVSADRCDVWGPIQFQQGAHGVAAAVSGLAPEKVHIHTTFLGGGYGRKLELDFIGQAVSIAKAAKMPVRLMWSREDDMTHDFYRPMSLHRMEAGLDAQGRLVGMSAKMVSPSITARAFPPFVQNGYDPFMTEGTANLTYNIANLRLENVIQEVGVRVGYWRSVSNALNTFAVESLIDEAAFAAKADPVAFRMQLLSQQPRAQYVLQKAAQLAGWGRPQAAGRFLGVAQTECYDSFVALVAEISVANGQPLVHKLTCVVDCGLAVRPDQVKAQIESGLLLGASAALKNQITFNQGQVEQKNFDTYPMLRMSETPAVVVEVVEGGDKPAGMGEVGVPLAAPAIANAWFTATGQRRRQLPFA